jgi:hypothetical protein
MTHYSAFLQLDVPAVVLAIGIVLQRIHTACQVLREWCQRRAGPFPILLPA